MKSFIFKTNTFGDSFHTCPRCKHNPPDPENRIPVYYSTAELHRAGWFFLIDQIGKTPTTPTIAQWYCPECVTKILKERQEILNV